MISVHLFWFTFDVILLAYVFFACNMKNLLPWVMVCCIILMLYLDIHSLVKLL